MRGAVVFVMYQDGNGNVTISARDGNQGHVEPQFDSTLAAGVQLLAGSGVVNGIMIANVKCWFLPSLSPLFSLLFLSSHLHSQSN